MTLYNVYFGWLHCIMCILVGYAIYCVFGLDTLYNVYFDWLHYIMCIWIGYAI